MRSDPPSEPWRSLLLDIDQASAGRLELHCIGGFAVSLHYGLARPTGDIDVFEAAPSTQKAWLAELAGRDSALHHRHRVYVQIVTVATAPYEYVDRLTEVFAGYFQQLRLFVLDPYDLALTKLERNSEVDIEDVKHLARSQHLDLGLLETRYQQEFRPYVTGPLARHDLTLRLWLEAIAEERRG